MKTKQIVGKKDQRKNDNEGPEKNDTNLERIVMCSDTTKEWIISHYINSQKDEYYLYRYSHTNQLQYL